MYRAILRDKYYNKLKFEFDEKYRMINFIEEAIEASEAEIEVSITKINIKEQECEENECVREIITDTAGTDSTKESVQ